MKRYQWLWMIPLLLLTACMNDAQPTGMESTAAVETETPPPAGDGAEVTSLSSAAPSEEAPDTSETNSYEPPASPEALNDNTEPEPPLAVPIEIDYEQVKPNESGNIMIIMYHGLSGSNPEKYDRKTSDFINDLQTLYDQGYRLIALNDLMDGHITVAAGYTPVVLTFDDGKNTAFSLARQEEAWVPVSGCAVDIIEQFFAEHPDFGKAATFFVNGSKDPFAGQGTLAERFAYLLDNGYEIGNHTYSHTELNGLNAAQIQEQIGRVDQTIRTLCPGYVPRALTYPYGIRPKESLRAYALDGEYDGQAYHYDWGLREGQSIISANPFHVAFDPLNAPRVRGTDDTTPEYDVQDFGYFLRYYENHPERRYISDGDPNRVSVPEVNAQNINETALGGRELYVY